MAFFIFLLLSTDLRLISLVHFSFKLILIDSHHSGCSVQERSLQQNSTRKGWPLFHLRREEDFFPFSVNESTHLTVIISHSLPSHLPSPFHLPYSSLPSQPHQAGTDALDEDLRPENAQWHIALLTFRMQSVLCKSATLCLPLRDRSPSIQHCTEPIGGILIEMLPGLPTGQQTVTVWNNGSKD